MDPTRGDSRYNLNYSMSGIGLSLTDGADLYGNPGGPLSGVGPGGRPPSSGGLIQSMGRSTGGGGLMAHGGGGNSAGGQCQQQSLGGQSRGVKRSSSDCYDDGVHHRGGVGGGMSSSQHQQTLQGMDGNCTGAGQGQSNIPDVVDDSYTSLQNKKSPPANGKKTKGRVKIKMEYIDNKLRRYTTFSKRKTGIMKKAYELSTLTGTQVMLLVASETGHVYTFATRKLQPMITSEAGKQLIQTCLNSPDPPSGNGGDQRMSATGFEETELSYNIADEDSKDDRSPMSSGNESDDSSDIDDSSEPPSRNNSQIMLMDSAPIEDDFPQNLSQHSRPQKQSKMEMPALSVPITNSAPIGHSGPTGMGGLLYPASNLANIPQEVLLGLVQSGHLQLHTEGDGSHQFITIPLSMSTGTVKNNSSGKSFAAGSSPGLHIIKDFAAKPTRSSTLMTSTTLSKANGMESPPNDGTNIKQELDE